MLDAFFENNSYVELLQELMDTTFFDEETKNVVSKLLRGGDDIFLTIKEDAIYKKSVEPVLREIIHDVSCSNGHVITVNVYITFKVEGCPVCTTVNKEERVKIKMK